MDKAQPFEKETPLPRSILDTPEIQEVIAATLAEIAVGRTRSSSGKTAEDLLELAHERISTVDS